MLFVTNDSMPTLETISQDLISGLPSELGDPHASDRNWTTAVKRRFYEMGKALGMMVCCHDSEDQGEWLLDVVWCRREAHDIVLAVECEWGKPAHISDDFDKLMSIKSPAKLCLFSTRNHEGYREIIELLESNMRSYPYHLAGEEYMLLEVTAPACYRYTVRIGTDGESTEINFEELRPLTWNWSKAVGQSRG